MRRDDNAILLDIAHAATLVAKFLSGKDKTALPDDNYTSPPWGKVLDAGERVDSAR